MDATKDFQKFLLPYIHEERSQAKFMSKQAKHGHD